jgi:hypothetical protein
VAVYDKEAHTRFHSILGGHGFAIAILTVAHLSGNIHDKYEAYDKIRAMKFDNWSADAFAEVTGLEPTEETP